MDEDDGAAWHQHEQECQRFEEEQALLRADPAFEVWLDQLELTRELEHEHD